MPSWKESLSGKGLAPPCREIGNKTVIEVFFRIRKRRDLIHFSFLFRATYKVCLFRKMRLGGKNEQMGKRIPRLQQTKYNSNLQAL